MSLELTVHGTQSVAERDATTAYRKLVSTLASRAVRIGSRDAEGAAQEALRRSLANPVSRAAVEYHFHEHPSGLAAPQWPLEQLFAWLHGVLRLVVREESARASYRREVLTVDGDGLDVRDPSPDQLELLIDTQLKSIVRECLSALGENHRRALTLRARGLKYAEIAARLGVNENTVAAWVHRGTSVVVRRVRERMERRPPASNIPE